MLKRRTDLLKEDVLKYVSKLNNITYVPEDQRRPANYIEILDDDGYPFILTKNGDIIAKYNIGD